MKRNILKLAIVAFAAFAMPTMMHAQLGNLAKQAKSAAKTAKTLTSNDNLIGEDELTVKDLKFKWSYREPGIAFGKGNAAQKAAGNAIAGEVEPKLKDALKSLKSGSISFKFEEKGVCTATMQGKEIPATYTINGPNIDITLSKPAATLKFNGRIDGARIQLAMTPSDLAEFIKVAAPASADQYLKQMEPAFKTLEKAKNVYIALWFAR